MLIAHLSDLHVMLPDDPIVSFVDTAQRLRSIVDSLQALEVKLDVLLITGDLVNRGKRDEYRLLRDILEPLAVDTRVLAVLGNHDDPIEFLRVFSDEPHLQGLSGEVSYVVEDFPVRFIGLHSAAAHGRQGEVTAEQAGWLEHVLAQDRVRATIILMHHPPIETGMPWMDPGGLGGAAELAQIVLRNPHVVRVLAGHVHRSTHTVLGAALVSTAPSPFYATTPPIGRASAPSAAAVVAAIPVLRWDEASGILVSSELDPPGTYVTHAIKP